MYTSYNDAPLRSRYTAKLRAGAARTRAALPIAAAAFLCLSYISAPQAQELRTSYLPVDFGLVPVVQHPGNWKLELTLPGLSTADGAQIRVQFVQFPGKATLEEAVNDFYDYPRKLWLAEDSINRKQCGVFQYEETEFMERPAYFVERGACVKEENKKPAHLQWTILVGKDKRLEISYESKDQKDFATYNKYKDEAKKVILSTRLVPESESDDNERFLVLYDQRVGRRGIVASRRKPYFVNAFFRFYHSKSWSVRVLDAEHATGESEKGRMTLGVFEKPTPGRRGAILFLAIEGLKPGALTVSQFLSTGPALMKSLGIKTYEETARSSEEYRPFWCVAHWAFRRSESTKQTVVRDYDAADGKELPWKMRLYTAGGLTIAANLIVAAPPERFDEVIAQTQPWIDSLTVFLESPALKPWGKCGA